MNYVLERYRESHPVAYLMVKKLKEGAVSAVAFQQKLATLRAEHELTQAQVGTLCGVDQRSYSYWESGQRIPRPDHLARLSEVFDIPLTELVR